MTDTKPSLDEFADSTDTESDQPRVVPERDPLDVEDAADADESVIEETTGPRIQEHADEVDPSVSAQDYIDAIQSFDTLDESADTADLWTTDMALPGFGEQLEHCGDDIEQMCTDCGHVSVTGQSCNRSTCPRCSKNWDRLYTTRLLHKLEQVRRIRADNRYSHQRFHHVVISPPADWEPDSAEEWIELIAVVKAICELADLEGYALYHPYSGQEEDDVGEWKRRIWSDLGFEEVLDELAFRPHVHLICVGHKVPGGAVTRAIEDATGWIINRITKGDSSVSLYDCLDAARALSYSLSHVGLYETDETTQSAVRGIGDKLSQPNPKVQIYDWGDLDDHLDALVDELQDQGASADACSTLRAQIDDGDYRPARALLSELRDEHGIEFGADLDRISVENVAQDQQLREQCDAIVRSVAPKTLDLEYQDIACQADIKKSILEDSDNHHRDQKVDVAYAEASRSPASPSSSSASDDRSLDPVASDGDQDGVDFDVLRGDDGSWGEVDPAVVAKYGDQSDIQELLRHRDDLDREDVEAHAEADTDTCEGRTVVIAQAPRYLNDEEWVGDAQFAGEAREAFLEFAVREDWGPDPDVLDDPPP